MLFVEDERDIVFVFSKGIQRYGYEVGAYNDPLKALLEFEPGSYDLALLDIRMPNLDGVELAHRLMQKDPSLAIFFWSAFEYDELKVRGILPHLSDNFFIQKPKTIAEVVKHIETHFEDKQKA